MKPFTILKNKKISRIIIILFWIGIWEVTSLGINREVYLPSPFNTAKALVSLSLTSRFWYSIAMTFTRVVAGFIISALAGRLP